MLLTLKELKQLTVETKSGTALGQVSDLIFQTDGQLIAQYIVKSSMLSTQKYTIHQSQVISISDKKMVVDDTVVPATSSIAIRKKKIMPGDTQPAALSRAE